MAEQDLPVEGKESRRAKELLGEATLLRLRGDHEQALSRCQEAIRLQDSDWEAYELLGDLLLELERPGPALDAYHRARKLNPTRGKLEEKVGLAAIAQAQGESLRQRSLDLAEGRIAKEPPRKPAFAAFLSLVIPGLGQIYNRQLIKGAVVVCFYLILVSGMLLSALQNLVQLRPGGGVIDLGAVLSLFFRSPTVLLTLLAALIWVFAIADAAFQASRSLTSDETGMV